MIVLPNGKRVHLIGDPHLGKVFEVGVPLHRRGERERKQFAHFVAELKTDADMIVMVGDLFDHAYVGYAVVDATAAAVRRAALARPGVQFVMQAGNHDVPRKVGAVGAFHDFRDRLDGRFPNLHVLLEPKAIDHVAFFPWQWGVRADAQIFPATDILLAVGHWDLKAFGDHNDHLAPVAALRAAYGAVEIWSGHYHRAGVYGEVNCTGSLEPMAHGEWADGGLYVTMTLPEALRAPEQELRDKCVRVLLRPGEAPPQIDCLQLTHERLPAEADEGAMAGEVLTLKTFDWNKRVAKVIDGLHPIVQEYVRERMSVNELGRGSDQAG